LEAVYVHEPDNPDLYPAVVDFVLERGLVPVIARGDACPAYEAIWDGAFGARRSLSDRTNVLVKSVACGLSLEWIVDRCDPRVVFVRRNPLNLVASWLERGWRVRHDLYGAEAAIHETFVRPLGLPEKPAASELSLMAWWLALQLHVQETVALRHPDWPMVSHDEACLHPQRTLEVVLDELGGGDNHRLGAYLSNSDQPGTGFETRRLTRDQPKNWRSVLAPGQVDEARAMFSAFPAGGWQSLMD
jgi:hypothetical protein